MADNAGVIKKARVALIVPSMYQVRKDFSTEYINRLAVSITKDGLKMPIAVRRIPAPNPLPEGASPGDEFWEILDGQCRWLAHKAAGLEYIQVIEYDIKTEDEAREWVLIANVQRKDLNPIEEAEGYALLIQFDKDKYTHEVIAEKFGKDRSYVTLSLQLLKLSESVKNNVSRGTLSRSHGLQLVRLPSADLQEKAMKEILDKDLNRDDTKKLIDKMIANTTQTGQQADGDNQADKPKTVKASHKANPDGVRIVKAGKRLHIDMYILEDTPPDAIGKAVTDACLHFKEEQNKPKPPKPDPKAKKAAEAVRKAEIEAAKAAKKLADLKAKADALRKTQTIIDPAQQEQLIKLAEAMKNGDLLAGIEGLPREAQIAHITGFLTGINQALANPNLPAEQRAKKAWQAQKLQAKLDELQKSISVSSPLAKDGGLSSEDLAKALANVEEQKKKMLEMVNSGRMSPEDMASVKAQYEAAIPKTRQELDSPGISGADATLKKAWIQMMQEVVEAINKKLGGQ